MRFSHTKNTNRRLFKQKLSSVLFSGGGGPLKNWAFYWEIIWMVQIPWKIFFRLFSSSMSSKKFQILLNDNRKANITSPYKQKSFFPKSNLTMPPIISEQCWWIFKKKLLDFDSFSPAFQLVSPHRVQPIVVPPPIFVAHTNPQVRPWGKKDWLTVGKQFCCPPHQPKSQTLGQ